MTLAGTFFVPFFVPSLANAETGAPATSPAERESALFALVVGNNQPEDEGSSVLRYADDDAVQTHKLLTDAGVRSALLARLDADSKRFFPGLVPDGAPRGTDFDAAVTRLFEEMKAEKARGRVPELFLFYSGHGDVVHGEGYVMLEDRRLMRRDLHALLARSPAVRNHVFVDACKSFFLAFERGPGGQRRTYDGAFAPAGEPSKLENVGFVLSTSSDHESHEWERFQGGIFSHELRSALRGAADSDRDGKVTYAELGAFVTSANRAIDNPRFRPDVLVRPPRNDFKQELLRWNGDGAVSVQGGSIAHFYVEDARGERMLDAHPAPGKIVDLHLPPRRPLYVRQHDGRAEATLGAAPAPVLTALAPRQAETLARGALQVAFEQFFAAAFEGPEDVRTFEREEARRLTSAQAAAERATRATTNGADLTTRAAPSAWRTPVLVVGATALASGLVLNALAWQRWRRTNDSQLETVDDNRFIHDANVASVVSYGVAVAAGVTWLLLRSHDEASASPTTAPPSP